MNKSILGSVPKPLLERAQKLIQHALEEKATQDSFSQNANSSTTNTETIYQDSLSLSEIIDWGKDNYPQNQKVSLAVIKENSKKKNYKFKISLAFVNDKQEMVGNDIKSVIIYCSTLDESLAETFGTDDIIIFE